ncbi:MAG: fimbrillin family protein [Parabacteroides sp.]|nr:fimbrillin family protein [Parabacteroides sp.]
MNNLTKIASILLLLPALAACSDSAPSPGQTPETMISLEAAIGPSTRGVIGSGYAEDLPVCFARQDETGVSSGSYGVWRTCPAIRTGGQGNRPIVFAEAQWYGLDGRSTHLHGYYPSGDVTAVDAQTGKVTFTIDGKTDIMATGCLAATAYQPVRTCTFRHLLTQVALACYSDRAEQWGAVTRIEAVDIRTAQQLDWQSETPRLAGALDGPVGNMAVQDIDGLPLVQVDEGEDLPEAQGYILLPVPESGGTVQLAVTTTKDGKGTETATVTLVAVTVEGGFQSGKRHVVSLFFTDGSKIQATSVGVKQWTEQDAGEIPI